MGILVPEAWAWAFLLLGALGSASGLYLYRTRNEHRTDAPDVLSVSGAVVSGVTVFVLTIVLIARMDMPIVVNVSTQGYTRAGQTFRCPRCQRTHKLRHDWNVKHADALAKYAVQCRWCGHQIKGGEEPPRGKGGVPVWTVIVGFAAGLAGGACLSFLSRLWRIGKALVKGGSKMMAMLEAAAEKDEKKS